MADAVDVKVVEQGRHYVVNLYNVSDGTGESAVIKVDVSTLTSRITGLAATYTVIDRIEYEVNGFDYVKLLWDANTDDEICVLKGNGAFDWTSVGGNADPRSTGTVGDILLTTSGTTAGNNYNITIWLRLK